MQIVRFDRWDRRLFCPVTGVPVFTELGEVQAPTVRGVWVHEMPEEPMHLSPDLQELWDAYSSQPEVEEDGVDVDAFLDGIAVDGLAAMCVTSHGFACGPVSETVWVVLDLQLEVEDDDETVNDELD